MKTLSNYHEIQENELEGVKAMSYIHSNDGMFTIWLNGGNSFDFENINPEMLRKLQNNKEVRKLLEDSIQKTVLYLYR